MNCKHYGINDHCAKESKNASVPGNRYGFPYPRPMFMDVSCKADSKCSRMRRYDRLQQMKNQNKKKR